MNNKKKIPRITEFKPKEFTAIFEATGCYIEREGLLLLLQYSPIKSESLIWGVPGGKLEKDETPIEAAKRELFEETKIEVPLSALENMGALYVERPSSSYIFHLFRVSLVSKPEVILSEEHLTYTWASKKDLETLPLMAGSKEALQKYARFCQGKVQNI